MAFAVLRDENLGIETFADPGFSVLAVNEPPGPREKERCPADLSVRPQTESEPWAALYLFAEPARHRRVQLAATQDESRPHRTRSALIASSSGHLGRILKISVDRFARLRFRSFGGSGHSPCHQDTISRARHS
jgi:hypothetical protein